MSTESTVLVRSGYSFVGVEVKVEYNKILNVRSLGKPAPHKPAFSDLNLEIMKMTNLVSSTWLTFFFFGIFFFRLAAGSL